ncbi:ribonuclease HI [Sulfurimonas sp. MAG313]|nr:ribonuclease H [Sulfurimonas sp. MAG313]MDF1880052.1 ribonuclease HI [Sulfurimonas sp. MAG313]
MQTITEQFLSLGLDNPLDISDKQLTLLDISLDKKELWFELALGKSISDARAELFVLLKDIKAKSNQEKVIQNYKALQVFRKGENVGEEKTSLRAKSKEQRDKKKEPIIPTSGDVTVYCDGGCSPNPGASGSGVAIYRAGQVSELWFGLFETNGTNNTAELNALYESLLIAQKESELGNKVEIKCDSMYSINCIKTWAKGWESKGWTKKGGEIKNLEIIKKAYSLYNTISSKISLSHIKAHAGAEGNELADRMTHHTRHTKETMFVKYEKSLDINEILKMY